MWQETNVTSNEKQTIHGAVATSSSHYCGSTGVHCTGTGTLQGNVPTTPTCTYTVSYTF